MSIALLVLYSVCFELHIHTRYPVHNSCRILAYVFVVASEELYRTPDKQRYITLVGVLCVQLLGHPCATKHSYACVSALIHLYDVHSHCTVCYIKSYSVLVTSCFTVCPSPTGSGDIIALCPSR